MNKLVLWHGWGMHPVVWDGLAAQLTSEHDITPRAQALPGYGRTSAPALYTLDALVDAMLADLPDLSTPITLCGWSLGAILAMHAARRHPHKITRLILISSTPSFVQRGDWLHGMTPQALEEFTAGLGRDPNTALKRFIALFNQYDVNGRMIGRDLARALAAVELPSAPVLAAGLSLLRDTDLRTLVPGIGQPVLLLHGANDPLMPLMAAEWLAARLPQARLEVLPDVAHVPFLSDPARCALLIANVIHA